MFPEREREGERERECSGIFVFFVSDIDTLIYFVDSDSPKKSQDHACHHFNAPCDFQWNSKRRKAQEKRTCWCIFRTILPNKKSQETWKYIMKGIYIYDIYIYI